MADYDRSIHTNPDAMAWTEFFRSQNPDCNVPDDVMLGWFANAMMAMHDHVKGGGPLNGDHAQYLLDQEHATGGKEPAPSQRATAKDQVEGLSQASDIFTDLMQRAEKAEAALQAADELALAAHGAIHDDADTSLVDALAAYRKARGGRGMSVQYKIAKQRTEIARLTQALERAETTKRDHVFRLRQILIAALDGHDGWEISARRELGRKRENE